MEANEAIIVEFRELVSNNAWVITAEQSIEFGFQMQVSDRMSKVTVSFYSTGRIYVQGKMSDLKIKFEEWSQQRDFVNNHVTNHFIHDHVTDNQSSIDETVLDWANAELTSGVFEFLTPDDRSTYLSGATLLFSVKKANLQLMDYSIVVMPFARVYEGFVLRLGGTLGISGSNSDQGPSGAGFLLNRIKNKISDANKQKYGGVADTLASAWYDIRNRVMHSDPENAQPHKRLKDAEHDIETLNRAICRGYEYLVERKIVTPSAK